MARLTDKEKQKQEVLKQFFTAFGNSGKKITAADVLEGLTKKNDIKMISSIPMPHVVVKAFFVQNVLAKLGYPAEASLVGLLADDYLKIHTSKSGDSNRAKQIVEAFVSIFKSELELDKSKGMFRK